MNSYDGMPEEEKADWDEEYATTMSLCTDVKILFRTVGYLAHDRACVTESGKYK